MINTTTALSSYDVAETTSNTVVYPCNAAVTSATDFHLIVDDQQPSPYAVYPWQDFGGNQAGNRQLRPLDRWYGEDPGTYEEVCAFAQIAGILVFALDEGFRFHRPGWRPGECALCSPKALLAHVKEFVAMRTNEISARGNFRRVEDAKP